MMELRPYQQEAVTAVMSEWANGHRKTLLVLPTGTGKTIAFAKIAESCVREGRKVLILAHREELLNQAQEKIKTVTGLLCAKEKAEETSLASWYRIVVGSVQTLMREKRLRQFPEDEFGTIIVDEAHHALADSYQQVLQHFPTANVLGVTATPERNNLQCLGNYFDSLAYEYSLTQAIKDGYLCKIKAQTIPLKIDITGVGMSAGDYAAGALGTALDPYLEQIAKEMVTYCAGRKTVVFLPLVATAKKFKAILNHFGMKAAEETILEREDALAKELSAMKKRKRQLVDPLQFEMSIQAEDLSDYVPSFGWEMAPASDKQLKALEKFGIFPDEIDNAGKASLLLDRLNKRRENGLSTPKQIRFLESRGFQHVGIWTFNDANSMISQIANHHWTIPRGIKPALYVPNQELNFGA